PARVPSRARSSGRSSSSACSRRRASRSSSSRRSSCWSRRSPAKTSPRRRRRTRPRRRLLRIRRPPGEGTDVKRLAAATLLLTVLAGCAVGPNYERPPLTVPDQYREVQGPPAPAPSLADQPWWDVFEAPVLRGLTDEPPAANH